MQSMWSKLFIAATFCGSALAYPSLGAYTIEKRDNFPTNLTERLGVYIPPGPTDSRGPCPGLNTLANHGLLNRNGKNISSDDVPNAFARGFGVAFDGIATALHNWEVVCEYVKGTTCGLPENNGTFILTNLTLLGEPHAFEHDHSFSREDYKQGYAHGSITDNIYFNSTEFQTSLNVVGYHPSNPPQVATANYTHFNQMRLVRESIKNTADFPGSFVQNVPPTLFEVGFIFGAMFDRFTNGSMKGLTPVVRLDWWNFWFSEESFPTKLGWVPASTEVFNSNFILSVSKTVLLQHVTSTPTNLPSGALATSFPAPTNLPEGDANPLFALFPGTAYRAPTAPSNIYPASYGKRAIKTTSTAASASRAVETAPPAVMHFATTEVGPRPTLYDMYKHKLDVHSIKRQVAHARSYESAIFSAITSRLQ